MKWMLLPLRRYADFSGRSRRLEFWMFALFQLIVGTMFYALMLGFGRSAALADNEIAAPGFDSAIGILALLQLGFTLATLIPYLAVTVRRLHDTDRSGGWVLAPFVPYAVILLLILGVGAAQAGSGVMIAAAILGILAGLAAVALWVVLLVFMFIEGTSGPNRFGPDPKQPLHAEIFA